MGDKKYDDLYRNAANLLAAYDELRLMRELFARAKDAEKFIEESEGLLTSIKNEIAALEETKAGLHQRCGEEAEKIKEQKATAEADLVAMKDKYIQRYEGDYAKRVEKAKNSIQEAEDNLKRLEKNISSKTSAEAKLDEQIGLKNSQVDVLNKQFRKIQASFAGG